MTITGISLNNLAANAFRPALSKRRNDMNDMLPEPR
jgi:hypothetical protein